MIERKNIDRLFQEKFKDFEVAPSEKIWETIEMELQEKKKKRRVIPIWIRLSGIAAALLICFFFANRFIDAEKTPENEVVIVPEYPNENASGIEKQNNHRSNIPSIDPNSRTNNAVTTAEETNHSPENATVENSNSETQVAHPTSKNNKTIKQSKSLATPNQPVANTSRNNMPKENAVSNQKATPQNAFTPKQTAVANNDSNPVKPEENRSVFLSSGKSIPVTTFPNSVTDAEKTAAEKSSNTNPSKSLFDTSPDKELTILADQNLQENKIDSTAIATVAPNALEELLKEKENKEVTANEPKLNRWQIASSVAPIYFSSTTNGSPLDSRFASNKKEYKPTVAYGVGVAYALTQKLSVRSGVSTVKLEYSTNDLVFSQTQNARQLQNVTSSLPGSMIQIDTKPTAFSATAARAIGNMFDATLRQKTGYVEVPVEMSYKLIDKKFGIEFIGGFSTLFLNENEVTMQSQGLNMNIGEASNLNDFHFSTNVGMGFKYHFLKSFQANFEPMFKYQINTFTNDAGNFKPYFFGFYTGLSYRF